ncbi:MAG: M1 family peptidase, partial [Algoriphagus sp.]
MHTNLAKPITGLFLLMVLSSGLFAQTGRFQQAASYQMDIDMNVQTNQYTGTQVLTYTNNSPDTLDRVFYHLYFNAFQPGSMMDERSRSIADPDRRVGDRISKLKPDEIGFLRVNSLKMNG